MMTGFEPSRALTLFTLNISGPSVERARRLIEFLAEVDADVLVLTETRANRGTELLLDWCSASGHTVVGGLPADRAERGVAIAHRMPPLPAELLSRVELPHRLVAARAVLGQPVTILGAYVPSRDASPAKIARKRLFLEQMVECFEHHLRRDEGVVVLGDFNVVGRDHRPRYSAFRAWEYDSLDQLASAGLSDVFAELNPGVQAHSWIGRTGDGYRYDYAFVSDPLSSSIVSCEYIHDSRERGLSDHAGVLMRLSAAAFVPSSGLPACLRPGVAALA